MCPVQYCDQHGVPLPEPQQRGGVRHVDPVHAAPAGLAVPPEEGRGPVPAQEAWQRVPV